MQSGLSIFVFLFDLAITFSMLRRPLVALEGRTFAYLHALALSPTGAQRTDSSSASKKNVFLVQCPVNNFRFFVMHKPSV